jgi:dihydroxyacetone kinase-like protein
MDKLDAHLVTGMLRAAAQNVIENEAILTRADQAIGDGDHGIGMTRGFKSALLALETQPASDDPGIAFSAVGKAVLANAGGASGAVFGTLFISIGKALATMPQNSVDIAAAFEEGARAVMTRGKAKAGDKTMLDALLPAVEALKDARLSGFDDAMNQAAAAASKGAEGTAKMIANTGRAKTLGERAVGHVDPGALSMNFLFQGMAAFLTEEGRKQVPKID